MTSEFTNIIEFNEAADTCLMAHKNIVQDICPVSNEKRKRSTEWNYDLFGIDTFSGRFLLKELIPTGRRAPYVILRKTSLLLNYQ